MPLSRPLKVAIGMLTAWPLVYMFVFIAFIAGTMFWIGVMAPGDGSHSSGPPVAFLALMAGHLATTMLMLGLTAFYIVFLFKTDRVPQDKKALWAVVLFLGNIIAMPVFFYLYVWPDEWPRKGRSEAASA